MDLFISLSLKVAPIYSFILIGFLSTKYFKIDKSQISVLLIYLIAPFVVFRGALSIEISFINLCLPIFWAAVATLISLLGYHIGRILWGEASAVKNILGLVSGTSNTGYFGLPVAIAVLGEEALPYCILILMGNTLFECTLGYYFAARGHHSKKDSLTKLIRLPNLYAFAAGLIVNYIGIEVSAGAEDFFNYFKACFSLFGIMIIGMGIASMKKIALDIKFTGIGLFIKFLIWPVTMFALVYLDEDFFHLLDNQTAYQCLKLIAFVPLPANAVAFSTELKVFPEKVALAVLISTLLSLLIIPIAVNLFF